MASVYYKKYRAKLGEMFIDAVNMDKLHLIKRLYMFGVGKAYIGLAFKISLEKGHAGVEKYLIENCFKSLVKKCEKVLEIDDFDLYDFQRGLADKKVQDKDVTNRLIAKSNSFQSGEVVRRVFEKYLKWDAYIYNKILTFFPNLSQLKHVEYVEFNRFQSCGVKPEKKWTISFTL